MDIVAFFLEHYTFQRSRVDAFLERIVADGNVLALGWRPGPGRAHMAWQFMHIAVTEEIFATERLNPDKPRLYESIWSRYRGGSVPDDNIPEVDVIRETLRYTRESLTETLAHLDRDRLNDIPVGLQQRGWTYLEAFRVLAWHEAHHHGQAHITYNLYNAQRS